MDNIIENIFRSCDQKNTDLVRVSSLIEFIKPYMANNLNELVKLQTQLDPNDTDPCIKYSSFQRVMSDWIAYMQAEDTHNSLSEIPVNLSQTFSSSASCEVKLNNNNTFNEVSEEVKNLKLQLNKAIGELDLVKQQLAACEDQNESLLADLKTCCEKQNREELYVSENLNNNKYLSEESDEKTNVEYGKYEQLQRMLSKAGKQQQEYLTQIHELENENLQLKNKLETFEKVKREGRKSISDMRDCLDVKEGEIATLLEIIENLKCELEDKGDILDFYKNEHTLLKQRIRDLENLLQNTSYRAVTSAQEKESNTANFESVFNTPKLLNQLANPVTPSLRSSLLKGFNTSSPLKNNSFESGNGSACDLFSSTSVVAMLKTPHKNLKEELAEISYETIQKVDKHDSLYQVVKDQEDIKNSLWQKMKKLCVDNEALLDYKKEYFELIFKLEEKDEILTDLKRELEVMREKKFYSLEQFQEQREINDHVELLTYELTNVEDNLKEQRLINSNLQKKIEFLSQTVDREIVQTQNDFVKALSNELKVVRARLHKKELLNQLSRNKSIIKNMIHQTSQTDESDINWNIRRTVSDQTESKKTNFEKQQLKIERLLEKQEKLEKELSNEKTINTNLLSKLQVMCTENEKVKNNLESCNKKIVEQVETLRELISERDNVVANSEAFKTENINLKKAIDCLEQEKRVLDEHFQTTSNTLAIEMTANNNLRIENEFLMKKQYQLESRLKEELVFKTDVKRQFADLKVLRRKEFRQFQDELIEKNTEIRTLKKQFELFNLEFFVSSCNEELRRAVLIFLDDFKNDADWSDWISSLPNVEELHSCNESVVRLESEMSVLNTNISLVVLLLQRISDYHVLQSVQVLDKSETSISEHEKYVSSLNEISFTVQEMSEKITLEPDSFLENLQLEDVDYRHMSQKEMEEKFATLALLLTVDVATAKKRSVNEKEKLELNEYPVKKKSYETVIQYLRQLKDVSEDMLKSAFDCGVLHYEKRTLDCWKFVINYVAALSQENKRMKETGNRCLQGLDLESFSGFPAHSDQSVLINHSSVTFFWSCYSRIKFWFCILFLLLVMFVFIITFYIDHVCPKYGKRMCPLQWIINLVIEKTNSHNHL